MKTVKVGEKGKHIPIPEGWKLVTSGLIQKGDKIAEIIRFVWDDAKEEGWVGIDVSNIEDGAVIRKIV